MCGLFGYINYSGERIKNLSDLTNSLARQSAVRGTDATGISFCDGGRLNIQKESKPAYKMDFKHPDNIRSLIGHTRHSTQGSERKNYNNHPFVGRCRNTNFALAHNGVLLNDKELRKEYHLLKTKIETDSYIAVQLIERNKELNFKNIKNMAELTEGSFSYSILDDKNNIWLVKGDSPLSILHFKNLKIYVFASTEEILFKALVDVPLLFKEIKKGAYEEMEINEGDILKIRYDGVLEKDTFKYSCYYGRNWWDYGFFGKRDNKKKDYLDDLKAVAVFQGFEPSDIDRLALAGFSYDEIEEYIYCGMGGEI